jgi:signal peptidase I
MSQIPGKIIPIETGILDEEVWIEHCSGDPEQKTLVTISSLRREMTILLNDGVITQTKAKFFVQTPPERIVTHKQVFLRNLNNLLRGMGYALSITLLIFSAMSMTGVVKARVVLTGSMAPALKPGDVAIMVPPTTITPHTGSMVAYNAKRFSGQKVAVFTHRIIGGNPQEGYLVKGDANPAPDVQRPQLEDIVGVVLFVIPYFGNLLTLRSLMIIIPCIFGLWMVMDALKNE